MNVVVKQQFEQLASSVKNAEDTKASAFFLYVILLFKKITFTLCIQFYLSLI
ncbi:hypothetical protein [Bacillus sp. CGMCC 1.16541]|uniref:hypothetical protein n=1 Tax=Bacillus sp. CGMCC 1.16541 TaxID=2185143 RepID=UPI0013A5A2D3|nr:hypothetical protein [Bacillus sp. CGMCC 1.16541]